MGDANDPGPLERGLSLLTWPSARTYRADAYGLDTLLERKARTVSVIVPARAVASTIGALVERLRPLERAGLVDELVVVDAASEDGTAAAASARGATVLQESELLPAFGAARGKGDAMWRGLAGTQGEIVAFVDADTEGFDARFVLGLLGPLFEDPALRLVKGAFRRPLRIGGEVRADEGGRVTELTARPLINLLVPELSGFAQPLAGEVAAPRALLEQLSFPVGYGVEIAMLIDSLRLVGLDALAQVDLGTRQNRHQPLRDLGAMAYAVLVAGLRRVAPELLDGLEAGVLAQPLGSELVRRSVPIEERPPLASLRATAAGGLAG
jgi:glucosyl-3-phosphoglycerate synthase